MADNNPMEQSLINLSQNAFKTIILINGGAAVSLLAFIGNVWNKSQETAIIGLLANSISLFSFGVLIGALGSGMIYICNCFYANGDRNAGNYSRYFSILLAVASYVLFGTGIYLSYFAFMAMTVK